MRKRSETNLFSYCNGFFLKTASQSHTTGQKPVICKTAGHFSKPARSFARLENRPAARGLKAAAHGSPAPHRDATAGPLPPPALPAPAGSPLPFCTPRPHRPVVRLRAGKRPPSSGDGGHGGTAVILPDVAGAQLVQRFPEAAKVCFRHINFQFDT